MTEFLDSIVKNARVGLGPCATCPAFEDGRSNHVNPGLLNPRGEIMFVTIEPSTDHTQVIDWGKYQSWEDYNQEFESQILNWDSGEAVERILDPLPEIQAKDVWIADSLKCSPAGKSNQNRSNEFAHCRNYLKDEIEEVDPQVIVVLGDLPAKRTLDVLDYPLSNFSVRRQSGRIIETDLPVIISTSWAYGNLDRRISGISGWGQGWITDHPHLQGNENNRIIDVVRASLKEVYSGDWQSERSENETDINQKTASTNGDRGAAPAENLIDIMPGEVVLRARDVVATEKNAISFRLIDDRNTTVAINPRAAAKHGIQRGTRVVVTGPRISGTGYVERIDGSDSFHLLLDDGSRITVPISDIAREDSGKPYWGETNIFNCNECHEKTLQGDKCPECGSDDLTLT